MCSDSALEDTKVYLTVEEKRERSAHVGKNLAED